MNAVPDSLWTHWHGHTEVLLGLAIFQAAYLLAVGPVRERYNLAESADPRQTATFTLGVFVIFFSILSPLHVLADEYLFSAHMLQHMRYTSVSTFCLWRRRRSCGGPSPATCRSFPGSRTR